MNKPLYEFFTSDHREIEEILEKATENLDSIDMKLYEQFRVRLLTHIKMEEKVLFPAAQKANKSAAAPLAAQLRLEHGAITTLMVPTPTSELIKVLWHLLDVHDLKEEEPGGMYDLCENLTQGQTEVLLEELKSITAVPVLPHNDAPIAMEATRRALTRAGYDYDEIIQREKNSH